MAKIKLSVFSGLRPRRPDSLLPANCATIAQNCDLAYEEMRNTKAGYLVNMMSNSPKSIYTDDGITFYSWTSDVNAVRSPLVQDSYNRLYYTGDSGFKMADRAGTRTDGGPPSASYLVGVPKPTVKPGLVISYPTINDSTTNYSFRFHYEYGGVKYQEGAIAVTTISDNNWDITAPAKDSTTPASAIFAFRVTGTSRADGSQTFDVYTSDSSFASSGGIYQLGFLPVSPGSMTFNVVLSTQIKDANKETRAVCYTFVNIYGEEGPPSPPNTTTTDPTLGETVQCTLDTITGYAPIKEIRVYRTPSGSAIAEYFYAGSISVISSPPGVYTYADTASPATLNEPLTSLYYYPPNQSMKGLMALPNGILCGWVDNLLCFSEAFKAWAWPPQYAKPTTHAIVGACPYGSGAVVTTVTQPYIVSGVTPDSMTLSKLNVDQAGVSKWSIGVANGALLFASNDGLVTLNGAQASLAPSEVFFTRDVWRARVAGGLSSMCFGIWDGRLVVFSNTNAFVPFMIRFDEADGTMTDLPNHAAACSFTGLMSDQMYFASGSGVYQFNGGSDQTAVWQSAELVLPRPTNFGAAQALVTGSWSIDIYAWCYNKSTTVWEWQLKRTKAVTDGTTNFRLPGGYESNRYKIKITGTGRFREFYLANTFEDLARP